MGMGMSISLQIYQQFVDLVFQDDLIKRKQKILTLLWMIHLFIQQQKNTWMIF